MYSWVFFSLSSLFTNFLLLINENAEVIRVCERYIEFPLALLLLFRNLPPRDFTKSEKCFSSRVLFSDRRLNACFFSLSLFTNYT